MGAIGPSKVGSKLNDFKYFFTQLKPTTLQMITVKTLPNQKPWVNGSERDRLRALSSALSALNQENLRKSRYDLRRTIRDAQRDYRVKLESNYHSSDPRSMWCGLQAIRDYKKKNSNVTQPAASLPDELNIHYGLWRATPSLL